MKMLLRFFLLPLLVVAFPSSHKIYVGQAFRQTYSSLTTVSGAGNTPLPSWLFYRNNILQGIPTENDIGTHTVKVSTEGGRPFNLKIRVTEETVNPCGNFDTYWLEAIYNDDDTPENRMDAVLELTGEPHNVSTIEDIRVYSWDYSRKTRAVTVIMEEAATGLYAVIWKAGCEVEKAMDEFNKILEYEEDDSEADYDSLVMTQGRFAPKKDVPQSESEEDVEPETTTKTIQTTTTVQRTTRAISGRKFDNKPYMLNALPTYNCIRGEICHLAVAKETFKDVEDGDTFELRLTITPLDNAELWMSVEGKGMAGVPLKNGEYQYRLEARDSADQMISAPFSVLVKPSHTANHFIQLDLDNPKQNEFERRPALLTDFVRTLGRALRANPSTVTIHKIATESGKTIIRWSNNSIPVTTCDKNAIDAMASKMIIKQKSRTKTEFVKAMTQSFYVRRASDIYTGNCAPKDSEFTTAAPTVSAVQDSGLPWYTWVIVLLTLLVLGLLIFIICSSKSSKKKAAKAEFHGKGMPVVFPDEVAEEDPINAGTPMLAREERPPLKVSQHENPLYKPPPPIAGNASPRATPAGSANQKLPPPFIPP